MKSNPFPFVALCLIFCAFAQLLSVNAKAECTSYGCQTDYGQSSPVASPPMPSQADLRAAAIQFQYAHLAPQWQNLIYQFGGRIPVSAIGDVGAGMGFTVTIPKSVTDVLDAANGVFGPSAAAQQTPCTLFNVDVQDLLQTSAACTGGTEITYPWHGGPQLAFPIRIETTRECTGASPEEWELYCGGDHVNCDITHVIVTARLYIGSDCRL